MNMILFILSLGLTSKINVDLDPTTGVLHFDNVQERVEPFRRAVVMNDPIKYTYSRYGS